MRWSFRIVDIVFCDTFVYLGHILENHLDDREDVNRKIRRLFFHFNRLKGKFGACSLDVKKQLWCSFINCLYGCGLWNVSDSVLQLFIRTL
jgi:hypothetical protein